MTTLDLKQVFSLGFEPVWVTTEEGGEFIPWQKWRAERLAGKGDLSLAQYLNKYRIHSVGFANGWIFDNMIGWRSREIPE